MGSCAGKGSGEVTRMIITCSHLIFSNLCGSSGFAWTLKVMLFSCGYNIIYILALNNRRFVKMRAVMLIMNILMLIMNIAMSMLPLHLLRD